MALNNQQWLIGLQTKPNQTKQSYCCFLLQYSGLLNSARNQRWCASPVVGSNFDQTCYALHGSVRVCVITGHTSCLKGPLLQALTLFGGAGFITWRLRHPSLRDSRRSRRYFWKCRARVGYGPVPGPTLKSLVLYSSGWWDEGQILYSGPIDSSLSIWFHD